MMYSCTLHIELCLSVICSLGFQIPLRDCTNIDFVERETNPFNEYELSSETVKPSLRFRFCFAFIQILHLVDAEIFDRSWNKACFSYVNLISLQVSALLNYSMCFSLSCFSRPRPAAVCVSCEQVSLPIPFSDQHEIYRSTQIDHFGSPLFLRLFSSRK